MRWVPSTSSRTAGTSACAGRRGEGGTACREPSQRGGHCVCRAGGGVSACRCGAGHHAGLPDRVVDTMNELCAGGRGSPASRSSRPHPSGPGPVADLERLNVQPFHLVGDTIVEAARRTVLGMPSEAAPTSSRSGDLDWAAVLLAGQNRFWVRAADKLASPQVAFVDAAQVLGRAPWAVWPPEQPEAVGRVPLLWLATPTDA